ncbi:MAG TPA: thermonuclease family protein [Parasegetibacter sp.]
MTSKYLLRNFLVAIAFISVSCDSTSGQKAVDSTGVQVKVTKVIDGDTFWVENKDKQRYKVRLTGLDAPEITKSARKEIGPYGEKAKEYLTRMIDGKWIRMMRDVDSLDRYKRTLAYVYLEDGTFVNAELIRNGYAKVLTIPPNVKFADFFVKLQREAIERNRGLWKKN